MINEKGMMMGAPPAYPEADIYRTPEATPQPTQLPLQPQALTAAQVGEQYRSGRTSLFDPLIA